MRDESGGVLSGKTSLEDRIQALELGQDELRRQIQRLMNGAAGEEVLELRRQLEDYQDALKSREGELAELSSYVEELEGRLAQQSGGGEKGAEELRESNNYLRQVNAHLEETFAETEFELHQAKLLLEATQNENKRLTERWTAAEPLLRQARELLDALKPPPPALAASIRKLRQGLQEHGF